MGLYFWHDRFVSRLDHQRVYRGGCRSGCKKANDTITVTGSAKMPIRSDYIIWKGVISSQLPERQSTYQYLMRQKAILVKYLYAQGIADSMINFQPVV